LVLLGGNILFAYSQVNNYIKKGIEISMVLMPFLCCLFGEKMHTQSGSIGLLPMNGANAHAGQ